MMNRWHTCLVVAALLAATMSVSADSRPLYSALLIDGHKSAKSMGLCKATAKILKSFNADDMLGIWLVDAEFTAVSANRVMDSAGQRETAGDVLGMCEQRAKRRNLTAALAYSLEHLGTFRQQNLPGKGVIIILHAGGNDGDNKTLEEKIIPELKSFQVAIHVIAVGAQADRSLLMRIAASTNGAFYNAASIADLPSALTALSAGLEKERKGAKSRSKAVKAKIPNKDSGSSEKVAEEKPQQDANATTDSESPYLAETPEKTSKPQSKPRKKTQRGWLSYAVLVAGGVALLITFIVGFYWLRRKRTNQSHERPEPNDTDTVKTEETFDPSVFFNQSGGEQSQASDLEFNKSIEPPSAKTQTKAPRPVAVPPPTQHTIPLRFAPLTEEGHPFVFSQPEQFMTVGRKRANHVVLTTKRISGVHAELRWEDGKATLVDRESTNGTYVNDQRIRKQAIQAGDEIRFDTVAFRVERADKNVIQTLSNAPDVSDIAAEMNEPQTIDAEVSVTQCLRHKNRIASQLCDGCTRPYCAECLMTVLGQKLCTKCRNSNEVEAS